MTQRAVNNAIVLYELGITSEELQTAREITEKVPALLNVLRSPLVTSEKKHHLIERVFDGSGLPRHLINFYKVMCNDGGIEELADIYAEWQKIWDTSHNRVRVECVFAETPSPEKENEIKRINLSYENLRLENIELASTIDQIRNSRRWRIVDKLGNCFRKIINTVKRGK